MRFCLLCKRYYTNKDLFADRFGRLYHLPAQLPRRGHEGLVMAADYRSTVQEKLQIPGVDFYSLPLSPRHFFAFFTEAYLHFQTFRPDVLIASGDSYLGAVGLLYARLLGIPFVFDIYDDYTAFASSKFLGMTRLFYFAIRKADLLVTASVPLQRRISQFNKSVLVLENGTDLSLFKPIPRDDARSILSIPKHEKVIGFFGSIERNGGIGTLIEAISILRTSYPNLRLLIAGKNNLQLEFNKPYIDYRGMLPQEEIPLFINACDAAVIPYLPNKHKQESNACKIAEYMACEVPVIATRVSNHAEIFADAPQGICKPGDAEDMALAIRVQLESPQVADFPQNITWENLGGRLSKALEDIVGGNPLNTAPTRAFPRLSSKM